MNSKKLIIIGKGNSANNIASIIGREKIYKFVDYNDINNANHNILYPWGDSTINVVEISDNIFSLNPNKIMIQSIVEWQVNHFKPRTAKTKQRGDVKGSTAKIYAQKGTGGARHSSRKAPIFVGGGVAHGPKGAVYKIKKINKMR